MCNLNNLWLDADNELVIVYQDGTHHVIEKYENWERVFTGNYAKCVEYLETRYTEYIESIIG